MTDEEKSKAKPESCEASVLDALLVCPFCGEVPTVFNFGDAEFSEKVMCCNQNCPIAPMGYFETVEGMKKAWNTRAN